MADPICFVDTETTGLDAERHEIWEVGLILPNSEERHWFLDVDETKADPFALSIGGYHERHPHGRLCPDPPAVYAAKEYAAKSHFAYEFAHLTHGLHLAGAVVSFDEERLRKLLLAQGHLPGWHYHLVDVEALAAGALAEIRRQSKDPDGEFDPAPPWNSATLSAGVGVNPNDFDRHTALGDARWAKAIYEAVVLL